MKTKFKIGEYILFKRIKNSTFGEVYLTIKENNPELLVTDVIDISKKDIKNLLNYINNEKEIMKQLSHPNIIRLENFLKTKNHYFFLMEYCNGGNLSDLLIQYKTKFRKPFPLPIIQYFMRQIVEGLKYIHSLNIIHRNIKLANILINFNGISRKTGIDGFDFNKIDDNDLLNSSIKISDFGLSIKLRDNELAKSLVGTPFNMDPLILKKYQSDEGENSSQGYNEKVDIWSLGTICYQMLTGDTLFTGNNFDDLFQKVEEGNYSIPIDIEISNEIISFLKSMLQYNGDLRPSAEELSKHDFLIKNIKDFTKIDSNKNPEAIGYIFNGMKNSFYINNHKKLENRKKLYINYIDSLYNDYKKAKNYFKKNNLPEREKNAHQKCLQIENIKKQLNSGKKIYLNNLPKKITPEYIYGCSMEERNKRFKEILSRYRGQKNSLEVKLKQYKSNEMVKNNKDEYEKNEIIFNKLKIIIEELEIKSKNMWVPPPLYIKKIQKEQKNIISFDKSKFKIKTKITRIDKISDSLDLIVTFIINQGRELKKKVKLIGENYYDEWIWILSAEEWMNIDNNIFNFILNIKVDEFQCFSNNPVQVLNLDVSKIKNGKGIDLKEKISDNGIKIIHISIQPILPEGENSIIIEEKEILSVKKLYPPFEMKSNNNNQILKPAQINFNIKDTKISQ